MILDYNHDPNLTVDQKLQSLMENIQLALNEKEDKSSGDKVFTEELVIAKDMEEVKAWLKGGVSTDTENTLVVNGIIPGQNTGIRATRPDTGTSMFTGIGAGGDNHGVYSSSMGKWLICGDGTNVFVNGADMSLKYETLPKAAGTDMSYFDVWRWGKVAVLRVHNVKKLPAGQNTICTLPNGYKPRMQVMGMLGAPNDAYARHLRVTIETNGEVKIYNYKGAAIDGDTNASGAFTYICV